MNRRRRELGAFLRSRRARLEPDFELIGDRRRVPGQRREEVAAAAGVSAAYYTRIEQGRAPNVSDDVLAALGRALRLDDADLAHAWRLARPAPAASAAGSLERVRPQVVSLLEQLMPMPALVLGRDRHLLAWNAMGHALHAAHLERSIVEDPGRRPWWPELFFCDPRVRRLYTDWPAKARDTTADLRIELGRRVAEDRLAELVEDLRRRSDEFDGSWSEIPVTPCAHHDRGYDHPSVGLLELHDEYLSLGDDEGQRLAVFTAAADSTSASALQRLEHALRGGSVS